MHTNAVLLDPNAVLGRAVDLVGGDCEDDGASIPSWATNSRKIRSIRNCKVCSKKANNLLGLEARVQRKAGGQVGPHLNRRTTQTSKNITFGPVWMGHG